MRPLKQSTRRTEFLVAKPKPVDLDYWEPNNVWADARCADIPSAKIDPIFFKAVGRPPFVTTYDYLCNSCPVKRYCLAYALKYDEYGVWGGMTRHQRSRLSKKVVNAVITEFFPPVQKKSLPVGKPRSDFKFDFEL